MGSEHYCLRWNNHQSNLLGVFSQLLRDESLVDVTLACSEGTTIRAHKVVLSACSSYFQTLFIDHPSRHPIVILKDVRFAELKTLVEFMYKGEVNVEYCQLPTLLKTAESLKVKGLAEMTNLATSKDEQNSKEQELDKNCEQTEPTELVTKKLVSTSTKDDNESTPVQTSTCDSPEPLELSKKTSDVISSDSNLNNNNDRPPSVETMQPDSPDSELGSSVHQNSCGANDLSINNNNSTVTSCLTSALPGGLGVSPALCPRLPSPHGSEPVAGPSGLPPVQQVPLSLKKEVQDWSSNLPDDKIIGECSSDYRQQQETTPMEIERCFNALASGSDHQASTHSSRSSTPAFPFPFPAFTSSLLEDTSARLLGLLHPALFADDSFRCPICLASFPSIWLLEQHTALQHVALNHFTAEDKPFVCDQCGQSYRYRSAYIKHREQNHRARLPADKLFSCDVCGMQFRYLKSFKKHRLNHALERLHGKPDGVSSGIGESNTNSEDNEVHDENTAESSNTAQESNNQVSSSNEMVEDSDKPSPRITIKKELFPDDEGAEDTEVSHSEKEVTGTEKSKEKCDQDDTIDSIGFSLPQVSTGAPETCSTSQEASILNFLRMDAAERQRERRFACPFCGKCVRSKENLKLHVRKHTGERPFVCLFCGRAFGGKSDLTRHLRIHTGERPYHCEMCGKCFARADYLSKHLTTHINTPR